MVCATFEIQRGTFDSFASEWDKLAQQTPGASVFLSYAWHETWWDQFGAGAEHLLLGFRDAGRLVAIAPLMIRGDVVSFLGGTDLVDYHDVLAGDIDHATLAGELFEALAAIDGWNSAEFGSLPDWSPFVSALPESAKLRGWPAEVSIEDVAPGLEIPDSWDDYLAGLGRKDRHELRRKLRRLEGAGDVSHAEYTSPEDVEVHLDEFFRLHRMSTPDKAEFMTPEREQFFRAASARLADDCGVRLSFTRLDGKSLAASLSFDYCGRRLVYNSGYDPEYRNLSVGFLNHALFIRQCIDDRVEYADFLRGNERYKYNLGATDRTIYRVNVRRGGVK